MVLRGTVCGSSRLDGGEGLVEFGYVCALGGWRLAAVFSKWASGVRIFISSHVQQIGSANVPRIRTITSAVSFVARTLSSSIAATRT